MANNHPGDTQTQSENPKVSVLLCVYNGGEYLGESVSSILGQSFQDFELVLVDDGSTDNAVAGIEALNDPRIRIIRKKNSGLTPSLNFGISHCRGEYIARQDADDLSHSERLKTQVAFMEANPETGVVGSSVELIDDDGDVIGELSFDSSHEALLTSLMKKNQFVHGALMFRAGILDVIKGYREAFVYAQDYDFTLRCQETTRLANLSGKYYSLRFGSQRISIAHAGDQRAFANMARAFARQRREVGMDDLDTGSYAGHFSVFSDKNSEPADQTRIMLYLYLRSGLKNKIRRCLSQLLTKPQPLKTRLKYQLSYLISYLPSGVIRQVYARMDQLRELN
ncbi:MAG: glycosyltransferase [Gammaproteobacteria bacterium]|nr:glycosyltransferase [Gammaproteobacteria bacterium]